MVIATHSEAFVKGVIDQDDDRVVVVRLQRRGLKTQSSVLEAQDIKALWADPLLRTSNILSALFHDVAVLMEGETDVRFTQSLMETVFGLEHLPDVEYYSCNGKSKIVQIARALRSVNVPTVAVVDIDILQNVAELCRLFEALGGNKNDVQLDAEIVKNAVESDRSTISGRQLISELDQITSVLSPKDKVPEAAVTKIRDILKRTSPWLRVKQDGVRGISDAQAVQAFNRLSAACLKKGLLINIEGELEGYCRTIPRSNKSEWLSEALRRDLAVDPQLAGARAFAGDLSAAVREATS